MKIGKPNEETLLPYQELAIEQKTKPRGKLVHERLSKPFKSLFPGNQKGELSSLIINEKDIDEKVKIVNV
jgi:hypothetical protein